MICNNANALLALAEKALNQLSEEELSWFENLSEEAELTAENLSESLISIANIFANENFIGKPDDWQLAQLLFGLSDHAINISAMMQVASQAEYIRQKKRGISVDLPEEYRVYLEAVSGAKGISTEVFAASLIKSALDEIRLKSDFQAKSAPKN